MLGDNIKKIRNEKGMTQKDLADKLFVTAQAVSRWENNEAEPSVSTITEIAKIFNVTITDLIEEEKPQEIATKEEDIEPFFITKNQPDDFKVEVGEVIDNLDESYQITYFFHKDCSFERGSLEKLMMMILNPNSFCRKVPATPCTRLWKWLMLWLQPVPRYC